MRIVFLFLYLTSFLSIGGSITYASKVNATTFATNKLKQTPQSSFSNDNQDLVIIDDSDFDLEEEYQSCNSVKSNSHSGCNVPNNHLFVYQYWKYSRLNVSNYIKSFKNFPPFCGYNSPSYYNNSILRI